MNGFGVRKIKKYLEENGIKTVTGKDVWSTSTIDRILLNKNYVGDVIMQKTLTEDFLTGKRRKNEGELDMYFIENAHQAILAGINLKLFKNEKLKSSLTQNPVLYHCKLCTYFTIDYLLM